jgi:hypothetical protein
MVRGESVALRRKERRAPRLEHASFGRVVGRELGVSPPLGVPCCHRDAEWSLRACDEALVHIRAI